MTIAIIDLAIGNYGSILNILSKLKTRAVLTQDPAEILRADKVILAGVGAFDPAVRAIRERGLDPVIREAARTRPLLGICLGMQLLANASEEGSLPGLGLIPGKVVRFSTAGGGESIRVPHMGWNRLKLVRASPLTAALPERARFYFMHSYYYVCENPADVVAQATYGVDFTAMIQHGKVMGAQFHPEKSHRYGLSVFRQFAQL
ncbi:MAG: imidazole glycerol phosphate synthase subunit HisH [Nevskiales bacterium]